MSTAMIVLHPMTTAARMALCPTPPAPKIAMLEPKAGLRVFMTPPAPVWMPQPRGPRISRGTSLRTLTTLRSAARAWVAKDDWPKKEPWMASSPLCMVTEPSERTPAMLAGRNSGQWLGIPLLQAGQTPQVR